MARLKNKVAIITGASGGIGQASVLAFVREGAQVMMVGRDQGRLEQAAQAVRAQLPSSSREALAICVGDVALEADTQAYVAQTLKVFGGLDILFANAGAEGAIKPLVEIDVEDFDAVQNTNLRGSWLAIKHAVPAMTARGGGSIILTASVAAHVGVPGLAAYATSKHGLLGLMHVAALELAHIPIRVNALAPAPIDNDMMRSIEAQASPDAPELARAGFSALTAMKRYGTNAEVASVALFLASDESSFCTGASYAVDGGFLAQ
jgi:NAD(P)-dependent dehydrogenase (short-subunit alcohol dehydrogenase family)